MKRLSSDLHLVLAATMLLLLHELTAPAITFTSDTAISFTNTDYDGLDIVVTNCTLTVDGAHTFASLQVLNAGNLTHTYAANGVLENVLIFNTEARVLSTTNLATLSHTNVVASSIVVQDLRGDVTYINGVDYQTGLGPGGTTTLLLTSNSAIPGGSTNWVSYNVQGPLVPAGLSLTVLRDVTVAQGGTINADGKGYGPGAGPGAGTSSGSPLSGSGGGHGGNGGKSAALNTNGASYDSIQQPTMLGSGGGAGYAGVGGTGGGRITMVVRGTMRVDGSVTANGANGVNERSGGGAGSSIWLSVTNLTGTGVLFANGGAGEPAQGGGGGGGRISLWYGTNGFSGIIVVRGGSGYVYGGAGTIYTRANTQSTGQVLVDNGGELGASTPLTSGEAFGLTAQGGAMISLPPSTPLTAVTLTNLLVASNAWINMSGQQTSLTVSGNATIQSGGGIIADGGGYPGGQGQGAGKVDPIAYTGGGGGYGGYGGMGGASATSESSIAAYGGASYGGLEYPTAWGSGGGGYSARGAGGAGGGTVSLNVRGTLVLDGRISADGDPGLAQGSGGGSGGSVSLFVGTLMGGGTISANGGSGNGFGSTGGGGGGGGRIFIEYINGYVFFGDITARGGSGSACGGAGTISTWDRGYPGSDPKVLVDNGGQAGTNTSWYSTDPIDLTVRGGAVVVPPNSQMIDTLLVASNGWVRITNQTLTIDYATVERGGGIIADSGGYGGGLGPGAGKYANGTSGAAGGGAGYGGYGAAGAAPAPQAAVAYGGLTYGSVSAPTNPTSSRI